MRVQRIERMALHSSNSMMQGGRLAMMTWSALAVLAVVHMFHEKDSSPLFVGARSQKATAVNTKSYFFVHLVHCSFFCSA